MSAAATSASAGGSPASATGEVVGVGTVLEKGDEGAMLCFSVASSLPPQCSGPAIHGWDWAKVTGAESSGQVRWGDYAVTGTWDGTALTMTKPAVGRAEYEKSHPRPTPADPWTTPCPEPAGGWVVVTPKTTTTVTQDQAIGVAQGLPGFGAVWVDQSRNPAAVNPNAEGDGANNPKKLILNVRVTQGRAAAEAAIRQVWGGMLCVTEGGRTEKDLLDTQAALSGTPGMVGANLDGQNSTIELEVYHDDGSLQKTMDKTYGAGFVRVVSVLRTVT